MMQNFGLEDLSYVQSRRNLLKYLVRVEMASDWFTRIYQSAWNAKNIFFTVFNLPYEEPTVIIIV